MLFEEQQSICTHCGHRHKLTSHHKIPQRLGGRNGLFNSNLVGLCRACHDLVEGLSKAGCPQEMDVGAAQLASNAHWELVQAAWSALPYISRETPEARLKRTNRMDRSRAAARYELGPILLQALEEIEPRAT